MSETIHPDYAACREVWQRARDVIAGEDAVKAAGTKYLPRLESQSDEEYEAYKARAAFFGFTARTLAEFLDMVFKRAPVLQVGVAGDLEDFVRDCNGWGLSFQGYARQVLEEVLAVGRSGSLVLPSESGRTVVSLWRTEEVLDWAVARAENRDILTKVVLRERESLRVFQLVRGACVEERWEANQGQWFLASRLELKREDAVLPAIPFVFHGPKGSRPDPERPPLADLISANLDHYRLDADLKHGVHFTALPTAWVSGFNRKSALRIGSSTAWVSELPGATAGFLEFSGRGLEHLERVMDKVEGRMSALGARMIEAGETEGAPGRPVQLCGLGSIVASVNQSLTRVLQWVHWWRVGGAIDSAPGELGIRMNTDLAATAMTGQDLAAVVAAWKSGAISRETMLELLKRGEVLPDGRTVAQERALIHRA